ncbi:MAG TPA: M23 family metallopeptidase [Verrucomicrobiae bacterium]|nr:M23 family metallopeptidase [Verrucomicrobiae bacterium]
MHRGGRWLSIAPPQQKSMTTSENTELQSRDQHGATNASMAAPSAFGFWNLNLLWSLAFGFWCLSPQLQHSASGGRILSDPVNSFRRGQPDAAPRKKMLEVTTREEDGVTHFYVHNLEAADVTATFDMGLCNLKPSTNFPYSTTFAGNQTVEAFSLKPIDPHVPWNYSYTDCFTIGSLTAVHDDSCVYLLPYAPGKLFRVTQGYHGNYSHTGPDEFAIDWKMPIGTPVCAARGGVVVKSRDDSDLGGPNRKYESCANCILIRHDDGTIGIYAHLKQHGNRVKVGDRVNAGDFIGLSGNTGFTSGPHLHFSVFKTASGHNRLSIPVKFKTADNPALTIVSRASYRAADFEVLQAGSDAHTTPSASTPESEFKRVTSQPAGNTAVSAGGLSSGN